eukprot:scaffold2067_cov379-Prasinococcus_capsulatus_cf.AAC.8
MDRVTDPKGPAGRPESVLLLAPRRPGPASGTSCTAAHVSSRPARVGGAAVAAQARRGGGLQPLPPQDQPSKTGLAHVLRARMRRPHDRHSGGHRRTGEWAYAGLEGRTDASTAAPQARIP